MDNEKNLFEDMKDILKEQVKEAYMEGIHQGSITTCAVLYTTLSAAGLEETNLLFDLLRDIAKQNGCEDLPAVVERLKNKTTKTDA